MAQVMVNFRMDETVKKRMEEACKEMGLSMTTAFTIFATKVGKEKRIPFEITAEPRRPAAPPESYSSGTDRDGYGEETLALGRKQEQLEILCGEIRRALTAIHTAIPSAITGLSMERIRQLCGMELKDKTAGILRDARSLFSGRNTGTLRERDLSVLDEYLDGLASIAEEIRETGRTLIPAMKSWSGEGGDGFASYEQRLNTVSQKFEDLRPVMGRFLSSTARRPGSAATVRLRIRQASAAVETPYVRSALDGLEAQVLRDYDSLDGPAKARLESYYLQTLELTLRELAQAERDGGDAHEKAALCLRTVNVLSQVISGGSRVRRERNGRSLEAEVAALERLAAMRGDVADGLKMEEKP